MVVLPITILQLIYSKSTDDFLAYSKTFSNLVVEVQVKVQVQEMFLVVYPTIYDYIIIIFVYLS